MIFRTINADAKKLTEQFGLLNKSFRDIKKDFANGLGFKNSLFQTSISKTDYQALQKFNSAIKVTNDGLTKSQRITKAWNENMTGCSIAAKRMGNDLVTGKKNIQDISKAMNTASGSTKALGVAMNVMANVGFMLAITAITKVISELAQAQENAIQATKEATETYKSELDSIADYKQRLSELHEELKSGNLSYEETKTKRTELMTIQDELIEKFGTEKSAIESVTDAVKGQIDALDNLNEKAYRDWVAKADEQTFWNKLLPGGKSGLDQAIDYMETEKTVSFMDMQNANLSDELQAIQKEIDETIRAKYNLDKTFAMFNVTGTPDEIRSQLENIRQDYADISKRVFEREKLPSGMWDEYRKETTDSINEAILSLDKGLEKHQDTYRTYIEGLIKYDSEYSDEYANILQKRAELESAQNSGNKEEVKKAKQEFMDSINDAIIASDSDESVKKYFESLYPELQAEFDNWKFEFNLEANKDGIADAAKEIGEKYTATDLLNMVNTEGVQEGEESFTSLIDKAIEYGVCTDKSAEEVEKLIDLLVELGFVQDNVKGDTFNDKSPISTFDQAWADSFISENDAVKELGDNLIGLAEKGRLTTEAFELADSNAGSYFKNLGISADEAVDKINKMVDESDQLSSMSKAISQMSEVLAAKAENGFASADVLSGFDVEIKSMESWDEFQSILGSTTSSYQQCEDAAKNLAIEWMNSGNFLSQLTEQNRAYYQTQLESMGITNAEEIVTDALTQKELELVATKQYLAQTSEELANATASEIAQFGAEQVAAGTCSQELALFYLKKALINQTTITTAGDCSNILALAKAADIGVEHLERLNTLMNLITKRDSAHASGDARAVSELNRAIAEFSDNVVSDLNLEDIKVDFSGIGNSAKSAAKETEKEVDIMAELNSEMDKLQSAYESLCDIRDTYNKYGKITVDQYQELTDMGFNFLANLVDENGELGLNASAFERLSHAKLQEMQIQMARNAIDTINGLQSEVEATEYLTYANENLRDAALSATEALLYQAQATAHLRGEQQGLAADQIVQGYEASKLLAGKVDFTFNPSGKEETEDSKSSGSDGLLDAYNAEKKLLEHMLSMDQTSKKEYYDRLFDLVHRYFDGDEEHKDQIWDVEESYHDYLESIKETYNWIEVFLSTLAKKTTALIDKAEKFITWSKKNAMINRAVKATDREIAGQTNAYAYYAEKARKVKLSDEYINKIQNGTLTMEDMQNEALSNKIEKYQEWLNCPAT